MKQFATLALVLLSGCLATEATDDVETSTETSDIEIRRIPPALPPDVTPFPIKTYHVEVHVLDDPSSDCTANATPLNIYEGIRLANISGAPLRVQFTLDFIAHQNAPHFHDLADPTDYPIAAVADDYAPWLGLGGGSTLWLLESQGLHGTTEDLLNHANFSLSDLSVPPPPKPLKVYVPCVEADERFFGHNATGGAHVPADFIGTNILGYWLEKYLHLDV